MQCQRADDMLTTHQRRWLLAVCGSIGGLCDALASNTLEEALAKPLEDRPIPKTVREARKFARDTLERSLKVLDEFEAFERQ